MPETLTTEKMARFLSTFTLVLFYQAFLVRSFLMNTNTSHNFQPSGQATGSDATILYLLQKVDNLQLQIHHQTNTMEKQNRTLEVQNKRIEAQTKIMEEQNKTMEAQSKLIKEQNKTLEAQKSVTQELLNFTRQTPSTVSISNDLSMLEMHVRRMMDEFQKLSNISDTTNLASEINKMANSVRVLASFLTTQNNTINEIGNEFKQHVNTLNGSLLSVADRVSQNERNISNHSSSISRLNTDLTVTERRVGFTAGVTSASDSWQGDILVFPHVVTNTGNCYNPGTGKFTAPKAGTYVFYVTVISYSINYLSLVIVHNGADKVRTDSTSAASDQTGTNLAVLELRQGDTVWVRRHLGTGYWTASVPLTTFSGFFL